MGKLANEVGRFLRKLRIDKGEILYDMANKMECSTAFISALELGKRQVTQDFRDRLCEAYHLTSEQQAEFDDAIALAKKKVVFDLQGRSQNSCEMLLAFARKVQNMNDEEASKILDFLTKKIDDKEDK